MICSRPPCIFTAVISEGDILLVFYSFDRFFMLIYAVIFVLFQSQKKKVYGAQSRPFVESKFTDWLPPEGKAYLQYSCNIVKGSRVNELFFGLLP